MPNENNPPREKILLADAHADYRSLVRHYLRRLGYAAPIEASDGVEALRLARRIAPALLIMELRLPKLHGFDVVAQLRSDPQIRHIWIAAATAMALPGDREKCLRRGFDDYLAKPFTLTEFERLVITATDHARIHPDGRPRIAPA